MKSKVLCYFVHAALVDEDDDGQIVAQVNTEPVRLFGRQQVIEHLDAIDELAATRSPGTAG